MSMFFAAANTNQALILETFGVPTIASREKLYIPTPCCQTAKSLKVSSTDLTFNTSRFLTSEGESVSVVCSITYSIDTSSRSNIMKAYKSFDHSKAQNPFRSPFKSYKTIEADVENGIKEVVSTLVKKRLKEMPFEEMTSIDLLFVDSIYQEAKEDLQAGKVNLTSFKVKEFIRYSEVITSEEEEVIEKKEETQEEGLEENVAVVAEDEGEEEEVEMVVCSENFAENDDFGADGATSNVFVTPNYVITVIPEESKHKERERKLTTTEVVMQAEVQSSSQIDITIETDEPIDHLEVDVPDVPDLDVPDVPDLDVPGVPDLDVPDIPDIFEDAEGDIHLQYHIGVNTEDSTEHHATTTNVIMNEDVPDLDVPDVPDIYEDAEGKVDLQYHIGVNTEDSSEHHATITNVIMNEEEEESTPNTVVSFNVNLDYEID